LHDFIVLNYKSQVKLSKNKTAVFVAAVADKNFLLTSFDGLENSQRFLG